MRVCDKNEAEEEEEEEEEADEDETSSTDLKTRFPHKDVVNEMPKKALDFMKTENMISAFCGILSVCKNWTGP